MPKVCTACGLAVAAPKKPEEHPEDCPDCEGKETVVKAEADIPLKVRGKEGVMKREDNGSENTKGAQ